MKKGSFLHASQIKNKTWLDINNILSSDENDLSSDQTVGKCYRVLICHDSWVTQSGKRQTLDLGSGHDLRIGLHIGLYAKYGVCVGFSLSLCPSSLPSLKKKGGGVHLSIADRFTNLTHGIRKKHKTGELHL